MNQPKTYGTFIKRGNNIYRTSAFIQWGDSYQSIGSCLLLNPGSAELDNNLMNSLSKKGNAGGWIKTEDPTMEQLIRIVEGIYQKESNISGRLHIYNHFNLQNTKDRSAVLQIEELINNGEYDLNESLVTVEELRSHPWLLLGWGWHKILLGKISKK